MWTTLCGLVVVIDMKIYMHTEFRSVQTIWKENNTLALETVLTYLLKKILNKELHMMLIVLMDLEYAALE